MKSYSISKMAVWESYQKVKNNRGAAGVDSCSLEEFEKDLKNNLYKIWNRMASGSYFPPPVKRVDIPKIDGKIRTLGIPTVADRIAQMVAKKQLEPAMEAIFHPDSYGYRPKRSAKHAVSQTRKRCWQNDWVIDIDIKGFFDNISHELMMRALEKHTQDAWVLLYISRWLKAPMQTDDGEIHARAKGTPQGGVISPLLANLFLHYTFDVWMQKHYPSISFERYADDVVVHCKTQEEAEVVLLAIKERVKQCELELHPEKTKIVYCQDANRTETGHNNSFDFLGFCFRPRVSRNRHGKYFVNFSPAISPRSKKEMYSVIREWSLQRRTGSSVKDLARLINPVVRGWIEYYGAFFKSELMFLVRHLNRKLVRWVIKKYKERGAGFKKAKKWLQQIYNTLPNFFVHWGLLRT